MNEGRAETTPLTFIEENKNKTARLKTPRLHIPVPLPVPYASKQLASSLVAFPKKVLST